MTLKVPEICLFQLERNEKVEELDIVRVKRDDMGEDGLLSNLAMISKI